MGDEKTSRGEGVISSGVQEQTQRGAAGIMRAGLGPQAQVPAAPSLGGELVLNGERYAVLKQLAASGEAETFLVQKGGELFVVKLYYPKFQPKEDVVQQLKPLKHPDIIALLDYGWVNLGLSDRFFEVTEYAAGGTLLEIVPIRSPERLKGIVEEVVNALHFCHERGIIHRDIKPQNIFFRDQARTDVAVGDFGISTMLIEGYSQKLSVGAKTPVYAALELFEVGSGGKVLVGREVDYYALGMTLIHLWTGEMPFEGLGEYVIMRAKREGNIPIPQDMPREFQALLKGLLTANPAKRWGYAEVQQWLRGQMPPVYFEERVEEYEVFLFAVVDGERLEAADPPTLAQLMEQYPEQGEVHLYRRTISRWLERARRHDLVATLDSIVEEEFPMDRRAGVTKAMYVLDPEMPFKGVDGSPCSGPEEIAECLERNFGHYENELKNPNAPLYLFFEARGYKQQADKFRNLFKSTKTTPPQAALNILILSLEGGDVLRVGSYRFREPREILTADAATQAQLARDLADPYSKLSLWLQGFSHLKGTVDRWRSLKRLDPITLRYAFGEGVAIGKYVVRTADEVKTLLRQDPLAVQPEDVGELNYWLKNYLGTSLNQMFLEVASDKSLSTDGFLALTTNALQNLEDRDLHLFRVLDRVLEMMDKRG